MMNSMQTKPSEPTHAFPHSSKHGSHHSPQNATSIASSSPAAIHAGGASTHTLTNLPFLPLMYTNPSRII